MIGLVNAPLDDFTKARIALFTYCHITEANYIYHVIWNLLRAEVDEVPLVWSFLDRYQEGVPPSAKIKMGDISRKAREQNQEGLANTLEMLFKPAVRNAFYHSDYILYNDELRLKHKGREIAKLPINDALLLMQTAIDFVHIFEDRAASALESFSSERVITGRKASNGMPLADIEVLVDEKSGRAIGFSTSRPLPLWGP